MRILIVARTSSPIAARWISQLFDTGWELHVYSTTREVHPLIRHSPWITIYKQPPVNEMVTQLVNATWPLRRGSDRIQALIRKLASKFVSEPNQYIASLIKKLQPDCIHSLQLWDQGHHVLQAKKKLPLRLLCPWILSVWGSDINTNYTIKTLQIVTDVLSHCDYLLTGNPLDLELAYRYGFSGRSMGIIPSGGGWDIQYMYGLVNRNNPSQRKLIAVKGYHTERPGGKVLTALAALKLCGTLLTGFEIVIHSAIDTYSSSHLDEVIHAANSVAHHCNTTVRFLPFGPPEDLWRLFGQSRVALAISTSDGTPNAMLEAMIMGAYPIQSNTGGLDVWIEQGVNGSLVPYDNPQTIADALLQALSDDKLVDSAAEKNYSLTKSQVERSIVRKQAMRVYEAIVNSAVK